MSSNITLSPTQESARFADLYILATRAEERYKKSPTKANFKRWHDLAREYSRVLRLRLDAKVGTS